MVEWDGPGGGMRAVRGDGDVTGVVVAQLPSGLYQVDVEGVRLTAHVGSGLERNFIRLLVGDRVAVRVMPRDPTRGRIVKRIVVAGSGRQRSGLSGPRAVS
jgi:translation initiation factor IF-1